MAAVNTLKRAIFADLSPPPKRRATFPERGSPEVGPAPVWDPQEEEEETLIVEGEVSLTRGFRPPRMILLVD